MKVLFHYDVGAGLRQQVEGLSERGLDVACCPEGPAQPFQTELADAEVIWHVLHPISADVIARAPRLRLIQKIGVGVNTIDLQAAQERGIAVCNMPGTNSRAVAEMTLLLML
jgi:lactate dehydrogenase-like 2-hydroxyacid dehydrogenase